MSAIQLTRRRIAREEIETAIDLVFGDGSLIAAHLLGWAAVDVLRGVAKSTGTETFHARLEEIVYPEKLKEWRRMIRSHYTFSKHSDNDPDETVDDFKDDAVYLIIMAGVSDYGAVYRQLTTRMYFFRAWILARFPHFIKEKFRDEILVGAERMFGFGADLTAARRAYSEMTSLLPELLVSLSEEQRRVIEI